MSKKSVNAESVNTANILTKESMEAIAETWFTETEETIEKKKKEALEAVEESGNKLAAAEDELAAAEELEDFKAYKSAIEKVKEAEKAYKSANKKFKEAEKATPKDFEMLNVMYAVVALLHDSTLTDRDISEVTGLSESGLRAYTPGIRYTLKAIAAMKK